MTVVSSWGCLTLRDERRSGDRLITAREGSPPRPCPQPCASATLCPAAPPHRFWLRWWWSAPDQTRAGCARRAIAQMKPTISRAIVNHDFWLADSGQAPISRAQAELRFPGDVAHRRGQRLEAIVKFTAYTSRHSVGPGPLDEHAPRQGVAGLG